MAPPPRDASCSFAMPFMGAQTEPIPTTFDTASIYYTTRRRLISFSDGDGLSGLVQALFSNSSADSRHDGLRRHRKPAARAAGAARKRASPLFHEPARYDAISSTHSRYFSASGRRMRAAEALPAGVDTWRLLPSALYTFAPFSSAIMIPLTAHDGRRRAKRAASSKLLGAPRHGGDDRAIAGLLGFGRECAHGRRHLPAEIAKRFTTAYQTSNDAFSTPEAR